MRASEHGASVAELQSALAEVYEAMQLYDYALHSYKLAMRNDAKSGAAVAGVGRVLCSQGRFEEAIELLSEGAKRLPNDGRIQLQLGLAYRDFRLDGPAVGALKKAVELTPADKTAYPPLLELLDRAKAPAAELVGLLAKAATALPDDQAIALRYGKTAHELKRYDEAQKALRRVLDMEPSHVEAGFLLGMTLLQQGNLQAARDSADVLKYLDAAKADELAQAIAKAEGKGEEKPPAKLKPKAKRKPKKKRR
ncbi:MAG: tetratricopeptide repeat protein [Deltaproteobacteria bacterium]|nr:tetratricopeptide repeat protein [Deltaproteobacteria bacterium]